MGKNYIIRYIRKIQLKRILYPLVFLGIVALILFNLPIFSYFRVGTAAPDRPLTQAVNDRRVYIRTTASDLYYTGDDYYVDGVLTGHYYYQLSGSYCRFYIIKPTAGKPADAYISTRTITGRIEKYDENTERLINDFAKDLNWTPEGLAAICDTYLINEVVYFPPIQAFLFIITVLAALLGIVGFLYLLLLHIFPKLSATYVRLRKYGDPKKILLEAEDEMNHKLILSRDNMVLTSKYLIEFTDETSAVIPLESVLWVFETRRMKFVLSKLREKMFYSLRIITIAGDTFIIKDKSISSVQKIEELLTDHYPNFFYGYSDEHDKMVHYILSENKKELKELKKKK